MVFIWKILKANVEQLQSSQKAQTQLADATSKKAKGDD
jgi:hypothetical protein